MGLGRSEAVGGAGCVLLLPTLCCSPLSQGDQLSAQAQSTT